MQGKVINGSPYVSPTKKLPLLALVPSLPCSASIPAVPISVSSTGAIGGHLVATLIAILGGAFLANYISEKLVGYVGGALFLVFAGATFFGVF